MQTKLLTENVRVTFDRETIERLRLIANREHKSVTGLVRELAEQRARPISVTRAIDRERSSPDG